MHINGSLAGYSGSSVDRLFGAKPVSRNGDHPADAAKAIAAIAKTAPSKTRGGAITFKALAALYDLKPEDRAAAAEAAGPAIENAFNIIESLGERKEVVIAAIQRSANQGRTWNGEVDLGGGVIQVIGSNLDGEMARGLAQAGALKARDRIEGLVEDLDRAVRRTYEVAVAQDPNLSYTREQFDAERESRIGSLRDSLAGYGFEGGAIVHDQAGHAALGEYAISYRVSYKDYHFNEYSHDLRARGGAGHEISWSDGLSVQPSEPMGRMLDVLA